VTGGEEMCTKSPSDTDLRVKNGVAGCSGKSIEAKKRPGRDEKTRWDLRVFVAQYKDASRESETPGNEKK